MEHLAATVAFILVSGLGLLLSVLFFRWADPVPHKYDPARHYMRGPGPACRAKGALRHTSAAR